MICPPAEGSPQPDGQRLVAGTSAHCGYRIGAGIASFGDAPSTLVIAGSAFPGTAAAPGERWVYAN